MFVGAHVSILHYVLGFGVITQDRARNPVDPLVIAAHQDLKQSGLSGEHPRHHFFISKFALRRYRNRYGTHLVSFPC